MLVRALAIYIGTQRVGTLLKFGTEDPILRFEAHEAYVDLLNPPTLSLSMQAEDPEQQRAFWADGTLPLFNGSYSAKKDCFLLPAFFQGLLPEGVVRDHIAAKRGCEPDDHFELLAATGRDLPGNVSAWPVNLAPQKVAHLIALDADSLQMSGVAEPMDDGISVSGMQAKLGVVKDGDHYVTRTKMQDARVIAKLPAVGYPLLPELEDLSLRLAAAAGVSVCETQLEPLEKLAIEHGYDLGDETTGKTNFLAVTRFDRFHGGRVHAEDFGQILEIQPQHKYRSSYFDIAAVMLDEPTLGEPAIHELLRRLTVNELLGNPDMHVKNIGVLYLDGVNPTLSPAYDIVAYSAYNNRQGHGLYIVPPELLPPPPKDRPAPKQRLSPALVRKFSENLRLTEKPLQAVISQTVHSAVKAWPHMIEESKLTTKQKKNLLAFFYGQPLVTSARARLERRAAA